MTDTANNTQNNFIPMGKIVGAFGVKGWVKIKTDTHTPDSLGNYKKLQLLINGKWLTKTVTNYAMHNNGFHAKFEDIEDRDAAMLLRGVTVAISRDEFPSTTKDEYYLVDLLGLHVYNKQQVYLGIVTNFMETGANTVLVIVNDDGSGDQNKVERLIPFVAQYVCDVDLVTKQIIVDWGLDY